MTSPFKVHTMFLITVHHQACFTFLHLPRSSIRKKFLEDFCVMFGKGLFVCLNVRMSLSTKDHCKNDIRWMLCEIYFGFRDGKCSVCVTLLGKKKKEKMANWIILAIFEFLFKLFAITFEKLSN